MMNCSLVSSRQVWKLYLRIFEAKFVVPCSLLYVNSQGWEEVDGESSKKWDSHPLLCGSKTRHVRGVWMQMIYEKKAQINFIERSYFIFVPFLLRESIRFDALWDILHTAAFRKRPCWWEEGAGDESKRSSWSLLETQDLEPHCGEWPMSSKASWVSKEGSGQAYSPQGPLSLSLGWALARPVLGIHISISNYTALRLLLFFVCLLSLVLG